MIRRRPVFGPLGRWLMVAFTAVAVGSAVVLTVAALIGTDRGLAAADSATRTQVARRVAGSLVAAYRAGGGWAVVDFGAASDIARGAGAQLVVRDMSDAMVYPGHARAGSGPGRGTQSTAGDTVSAPVVVDGRRVGTVMLALGPAAPAGRSVAWEWIGVAAGVALLLALAVSGFVARRLGAPLSVMTRAARAFAGGDRAARARVRAPGEVGELGRALDAMAEQVVCAEATRRQLSADVAHELRTPLSALQAGLEELRDGMVVADAQRLAALHDQSLRLGRVVQDLADLAAAEAAAMSLHLADADLATVVATTVDGQEPMLRSAGLSVHRDIHPPVPVRADADRLHQAVTNLLANAARYCRAGDEVHVRVRAEQAAALVEVADTGPGIEPAELPHVFERLWRGTAGERVAGAGIGLAVVRELVTAHGGTLTAYSTPGRGATFTIRLPLARTRQPATVRR